MYLKNKVKNNRRLRFSREFLIVEKNRYIIYDFEYKEFNKNFIKVHRKELNNINYKLDKKQKPRKIRNLKWLFSQKAFKSNLNTKNIKLSQFRELKKVLNNINKFSEYFSLKNIAFFINSGSNKNFIERHRLLSNFKSNTTLLPQILRYGITEGKKKYTKGFKSGKDNPGYKHNGRFSPYSKKFIKYQNLDEQEKNNKIKDVVEKANKNRVPNTSLEYYVNKGYTLDESKKLLSKRQITFSKEKLINKFGVQGYIKWYKRQQKWQNTLNSKPKKEIEEMNMKKGKGGFGKFENGRFYINKKYKNKQGILYYFTFFENNKQYWKIGISTKKFNERFKKKEIEKYNIKLIEITEDNIENCFLTEQMILKTYSKNRVRTTLSTECFNRDIL